MNQQDIKLIAFYLPQYHPIPENDEWWGKGFTEWTNVSKAEPRFPGHHQPHVPAQLGYYDLRDPDARRAQADLARAYGIYGFCYYHYWFNGKRLLEQPFNSVLNSGVPDFPFCLCWANENWTRRWDGADQEILIAQNYSDLDSLNFIRDLIPAFRDERYIRINERPLLLVYKTAELPDPKRTSEIWREAAHSAGIGDLYLVRVENFFHGQETSPDHIGFDAAVEFAPYWGSLGQRIYNLAEAGFSPHVVGEDIRVFDYETIMANMLVKQSPNYKLFRGIFPTWDNSARRKKEPLVVVNSSPEAYALWLSQLIDQTVRRFETEERLIFINAWNEWGEGCHLEPDAENGTKYLEATKYIVDKRFDKEPSVFADSYETFINRLLIKSFKQNKNYELDNASLRNQIAREKQSRLEKENVIDALYESLSWKLTKPLRSVYSMLIKASHKGNIVKASAKLNNRTAFDAEILLTAKVDSKLINKAINVKTENYDVIIFPVIDWGFRFQRPQQIAKQLAYRGHRVFYITTEFNNNEQPGFTILDNPLVNVFNVKLNCPAPLPNIYSDTINAIQTDSIILSLLLFYRTCLIQSPVSIVDLPFWRPIVEALPGNLVLYDCMDHHAGFSTNTKGMLREEGKLLQLSDLVITSSQRLSEIIARKVPNEIVRNGAEIEFFAQRAETIEYSSDRPVIGYYGAISDWFDMDLVVTAAKAHPEWEFLLIGSTFGSDTRKAKKLSNVRFLGEVPYTTLPGYLCVFDVCMIPFKLNELTLCTNPVKVYEYLATGKPVVTTAMPELMMIGEYVHVAETPEEFIKKLEIAMAQRTNKQLCASRVEWAKQHDWSERVLLLDRHINSLFPKVSIIVLTYNNIDLTKDCLDSIERFTSYPNLELIVVDNASTDGTPEFLKSFAASRQYTKIILNDANLGFAAGNNVGARAATGEYIIILNNDTYVTQGWLFDLIRHLRKHMELGLVGPVTNSIGNEAQIEVQYDSKEVMQIRAIEYTTQHPRQLLYVRTIAFFCVALRRSTWEKIGPLDEGFSVGFFEDDDYCRRLEKAGFKVAIAEDVFIHHEHSASFDALKAEKKKAIFEKNKEVYEKKWGKWEPHVYRR